MSKSTAAILHFYGPSGWLASCFLTGKLKGIVKATAINRGRGGQGWTAAVHLLCLFMNILRGRATAVVCYISALPLEVPSLTTPKCGSMRENLFRGSKMEENSSSYAWSVSFTDVCTKHFRNPLTVGVLVRWRELMKRSLSRVNSAGAGWQRKSDIWRAWSERAVPVLSLLHSVSLLFINLQLRNTRFQRQKTTS